MTMQTGRPLSSRNYFIDEAGNGELFDRQGRVIVGTEGCSLYFMIGLLDVGKPETLTAEMENLRINLLADPYFKGVPSMQPEARKTALFFHAKDDLPEVRREVFALLRKQKLRFHAVVRDKNVVVRYIRQRNSEESTYRFKPNDLYNDLVSRLFNGLLYQHDEYNICFARRVKSDQTAALRTALQAVQNPTGSKRPRRAGMLKIETPLFHERAELQAVDYFLRALQRFYERGEDRYLELLWPAIRLVHDVDDVREGTGGTEYTQKRPLTLAVLKEKSGV